MSDPIFPLRQWPSGIQQASVPANDNALREEAVKRPALGVANDASGSDVDGDMWIVGDTPAGAFAAFEENDVALYQFGSWYAWAPTDGLRLIVNDVPKIYVGGSTNEWQDDTSDGISDAPSDGSTYGRKDGAWEVVAGTGDVTGPASSTDGNLAVFDGATGKLLKDGGAPGGMALVDDAPSDGTGYVRKDGAWAAESGGGGAVDSVNGDTGTVIVAVPIIIACSDETTALTTGAAKATFRMPYAFTLTAVRASVTTAPTGSALTVDINEGGSSILSTKLTIDAGEKTSTTAATPPAISDTALADDAEITIDIDGVGSSTAGAGLKVTLIGYAP